MNAKTQKFVDNLVAQASDNPLVAFGVAAAFITATGKLLDANTARVAAKTHAKEVARRIAKSAAK